MKKESIITEIKKPYVFKKFKMAKHVSYNHSYWLYNKQYFFKYPNGNQNAISFIVNEILVSHLCKELGVDCVECSYAINQHKTYEQRGVISKSFLSEDEETISLLDIKDKKILEQYPKDLFFKMKIIFAQICPLTTLFRYKDINMIANNILLKYKENSPLMLAPYKKFVKKHLKEIYTIEKQTKRTQITTIDECELIITNYAKVNGYEVDKNIRLNLQKMAIIDAVTKQFDRHMGNISLIYNKKTNMVRLAPLYDNGLCEYFGANTQSFIYPNNMNFYLALTHSDFKDIFNKQTEISKFYDKIKSFYTSGDFDKFVEYIKNELSSTDLFKLDSLNKKTEDDYCWDSISENYKQGLNYINNKLKQHIVMNTEYDKIKQKEKVIEKSC